MLKEKNNAADICSTIHSTEKIDPFEGLDLDEICVAPKNLRPSSPEDPEKDSDQADLFDMNPLDGIDVQGISVDPDALASTQSAEGNTPDTQNDVDFVMLPNKESDDSREEQKRHPGRKKPSRSTGISHPLVAQPGAAIKPIVEKAYHYAELTQIREKIFSNLEKSEGNTLLLISPRDNTGTSLLAAALGYNTACSCQKNVLLIDCNMRRAGLHSFFNLPQPYGFTDLIRNNLPWQAVVKETGIEYLSIITAGEPCANFSDYLRYSDIPNFLQEIRHHYDLIIFDTSPVLNPNRNNVNIVSLTSVADFVLLITKHSGTTKDHLKEVQTIIEAGNGKIDGIVINEYNPEKKPAPYPK